TSTTQAISKLKCKTPFLGMLKSLDVLHANEKLNTMAINTLKANTMYLIDHFSEAAGYGELIYIAIEKFSKLRQSIPDKPNDYGKDVYLKLEKYLGYISYRMEKIATDAPDIVKEVKKNIELFKLKN